MAPGPERWWRPLAATGALLGLGLVSACGSPTPTSDPSAGASGGASAVVIAEPFASLRSAQDAQARTISDGVERAIVKCMRARGFTYTPVAYRAREPRTRHIGDIEFAKTEGFGGISSQGNEPPPYEDLKGLSPVQAQAWQAALGGGPVMPDQTDDVNVVSVAAGSGTMFMRKDSCGGRAQAEVAGGDLKTWLELPLRIDVLAGDVRSGVEQDKRFLDVQARWSTCIRDLGYSAQTLGDLREAVGKARTDQKKSDAQARADEIAAATASAQCEAKVGMADVYRSVQAEKEKTIQDANQGLFTRWAELNSAAAQRAKAEA